MNNESRPHIKPGAIKTTKGYRKKVLLSKLTTAIIGSISLLLVGLTIYIYIVNPVKISDNLSTDSYIVAEPIRNRMPEVGEKILFVETDKYNMFTPLLRAVTTQDVYEAEIIAGPYGEFKKPNENFVVVYGEKTTTVNIDVNLEDSDEKYLDREFVVRIGEKEDKIITENHILGNVK